VDEQQRRRQRPIDQDDVLPWQRPADQIRDHNESFYLPDQTIEDSISVEIFTPRGGRSNAAPYRMTCMSDAPG
jgi:hypothetical protein